MGALCSVSSLGALVVILKLMMPVCIAVKGVDHIDMSIAEMPELHVGYLYRLSLPAEPLHPLHGVLCL